MNNNIYMRILEVKIFRNMYVTGSKFKYYTLSIHFYTKSNGNSKY